MTKLLSRMGTAVVGAAVLLALSVTAAFADAHTAAITSEITDAFSGLQTIVLAVIGALFALVIVGVAVRVGQKYVKRGGSSA